MSAFGYSPGDRVFVFKGGEIVRDDLVFERLRGSNTGFTLVSPDGRRLHFGPRGVLRGHSEMKWQARPVMLPKDEQERRAPAALLQRDRNKARSEIDYRARALELVAAAEIKFGDTRKAREHALAILAALDNLDAQERDHAIASR